MTTAGDFLETLATVSEDPGILDIKRVLGTDAEKPISEDILTTLIFLRDAIRRAIGEDLSGNLESLHLQLATYEKVINALNERLKPSIVKIEYIVAIHYESEKARQVALLVVTALMQQGVRTPAVSIGKSIDQKESLLKIIVVSTAQNPITESDLFAIVQTVCRRHSVGTGATFFN